MRDIHMLRKKVVKHKSSVFEKGLVCKRFLVEEECVKCIWATSS